MAFQAIQKHPRYTVSFPVGVVKETGDVEELSVENISLGGLFIRTRVPAAPGSFLRMHLSLAETAPSIALMGRVVHVIDLASSVTKSRAPGMGVQFDGLAPEAEKLLRRCVEALADAERKHRLRKDAARFVDAGHVHASDDRAILARAWSDGLEQYGTLHAFGEARLGNRVSVVIGPLAFHADVVAVDESPGATLKLIDLEGWKRESVRRYVEGITATITTEPAPELAGRVRLPTLLKEVDLLMRAGRRSEAERALAAASELLSDDEDVRQRLHLLREQLAAADAMDLLDQLMRDAPRREVVRACRKAVRISTSRDVLRRAMRLLQKTDAVDDMVVIADKLVALDPHDELPLFALLDAHERRELWAAAARAGEALLRLRPDDAALEARVNRILEIVRAH